MNETSTATDLRNQAAAHEQAAQDSFDRCDTDGFLSQWAHGLSAEKARRQAEIVEAGGVAEFAALYDLSGNRVPAKLIRVADKFKGYGTRSVWMLLDPANPKGKALGFVNRPAGGPRSHANLRAKGYVEGTEMAPAMADIVGTGYGLSGTAVVAVIRTDGGWSGCK